MPPPRAEGTVPIPVAKGRVPFLGSLPEIDMDAPTQSLMRMTDKYGEIYRIYVPTIPTNIVIGSYALVNEVCDEKRFRKQVSDVTENLRNCVHDGLFTARTEELNWGIAHRILTPTFGPMAIRDMFDEMHDIASQAALKWARHGSSTPIPVAEDFSRLTFDTIALCAMGYRFNSFYHDEPPAFLGAMSRFLTESGTRAHRLLPDFFYRRRDAKYRADIDTLRGIAQEVLETSRRQGLARKQGGQGRGVAPRRNLLTAMLDGVDPKTGRKMTDSSIIDNLLTFLVAGHETTSGLLSFAFHRMLENPAVLAKAQREVDDVVGKDPVRPEHLPKLHYINAVLRETLRVNSGIPLLMIEAIEDTVIGGGKYAIPAGETIMALIAKSQTDPAVFGDDAAEFRPERMLDDEFERLQCEFPNCWKPFGNGVRGCIGRPFAWQESLLVVALMLQNFDFVAHDPEYRLVIQETLTLKPQGLKMHATLRDGLTPLELELRLAGSGTRRTSSAKPTTAQSNKGSADGAAPTETADDVVVTPISIFYGSNSGTCEAMAHRLATDAASQGLRAVVVDAMDTATRALPNHGPVVLITASYEGKPPENAARFVAWLQGLESASSEAGPLSSIKYAVFGCGHHDWSTTFHRIPRFVDARLSELGATRLAPMGLTDAADSDMFADFENWELETLWPAMARHYGFEPPSADSSLALCALDVRVSAPRSAALRQEVGEAVVEAARDLVAPGQPPKRHLELRLPAGGAAGYRAGDHLAVLPLNPPRDVRRAMRRLGLADDAHVTIGASGRTTLPTGTSMAAREVLSAYVELGQPATRRGVSVLAEACASTDEETRSRLQDLAGDAYASEIGPRRVSQLDLLERFPSVELDFGRFLALLPPMRVRQYSISSSPLWKEGHATLTYSVLDGTAFTDPQVDVDKGDNSRPGHNMDATHERRHLGVASTYLASLAPGDRLRVAPRPSNPSFHLPADPSRAPLVCIASGSGIAPFRGFVQERAALLAAGRADLAPLLLFFGCRAPALDDLYRDELDRWEALGAVSVRRAFSRRAEASAGCAYVQDRLWLNRDEVAALWDEGAKVFVCGGRELGERVKEMMYRIVVTRSADGEGEEGTSAGKEEVRKWLSSVRGERFAIAVFD